MFGDSSSLPLTLCNTARSLRFMFGVLSFETAHLYLSVCVTSPLPHTHLQPHPHAWRMHDDHSELPCMPDTIRSSTMASSMDSSDATAQEKGCEAIDVDAGTSSSNQVRAVFCVTPFCLHERTVLQLLLSYAVLMLHL